MSEVIRILGTKIDNFSQEETNLELRKILGGPAQRKYAVTLNPEIMLKAHNDEKYRDVLNSADLRLCDGFGIKIIASFLGKKIKERYTGVELTDFLLRAAKERNMNVLIAVFEKSLARPDEIERGIEEKYGLKVHARYFSAANFSGGNEVEGAEIIFVNFGAPDQEKFIFENRGKFSGAKMLVGVGGAFDFMTGKIRRAPHFLQKMGLEWFWRLMQEPKRLRRIMNAVLIFPALAIMKSE